LTTIPLLTLKIGSVKRERPTAHSQEKTKPTSEPGGWVFDLKVGIGGDSALGLT